METTMNDFNVLPTNYIDILLRMSNDTKLRVIRLLTDSLLKSEKVMTEDSKSYTQALLKKHAGSWVDDEKDSVRSIPISDKVKSLSRRIPLEVLNTQIELNPTQLHLLKMFSYAKTEEDLEEIKKVLADYFARKVDEEMDKLWEIGELNEEKVESFRNLHERTPYNFSSFARNFPE